jgi:hypothetical protein
LTLIDAKQILKSLQQHLSHSRPPPLSRRTRHHTPTNFMECLPFPRFRAYLGASTRVLDQVPRPGEREKQVLAPLLLEPLPHGVGAGSNLIAVPFRVVQVMENTL